jgi:hypothetical protein
VAIPEIDVYECDARGGAPSRSAEPKRFREPRGISGDLMAPEPGQVRWVKIIDRGYLQPGLKIQAEIRRERVKLTVVFEVIKKREIRYENQAVWNMLTQEDIWNHLFTFDNRVVPVDCYEDGDKRPWYPNTVIFVRLKEADVRNGSTWQFLAKSRTGSEGTRKRERIVQACRKNRTT